MEEQIDYTEILASMNARIAELERKIELVMKGVSEDGVFYDGLNEYTKEVLNVKK